MTDPLVSVIMPAYNAQKFIAASMNSVMEQSYVNWELIIADDGSIDETAAIVQKIQETEPRIRYIYQPNGKQGKARNNAIKNSCGQYLAFLDADDLWTNDKLKIQINRLESRPDIDLIFSQGYTLLPDGSTKASDFKIREWTWVTDGDELIDCNQVPILSVIVNKEAVVKAGYFSENPAVQNAEDYHLWIKLLKSGAKFLSIADRLFYYRIHENQSTYQQRGMYLAIINSYFDLIANGIIDKKNEALKFRVKWMIFNEINPLGLYEKLKAVFAGKEPVLWFYLFSQRHFPKNVLARKVAHWLL